MTTFAVIRKADGMETYRYQNDVAISFAGCEFATHDHVVVPDVAAPPVAAPVLEWERLVFLRRFTMAERIAIRTARATDPILNDFFSLLEEADTVHSNDPDVLAGTQYLVMTGYLTPGRRLAILGAD